MDEAAKLCNACEDAYNPGGWLIFYDLLNESVVGSNTFDPHDFTFQPDYVGEGVPQIGMDFSQLFEVARGLGDRYGHLVNLVDGLKHARGVELFGSLVQELHEAGLGEVLTGADALKINKNDYIIFLKNNIKIKKK